MDKIKKIEELWEKTGIKAVGEDLIYVVMKQDGFSDAVDKLNVAYNYSGTGLIQVDENAVKALIKGGLSLKQVHKQLYSESEDICIDTLAAHAVIEEMLSEGDCDGTSTEFVGRESLDESDTSALANKIRDRTAMLLNE